MTTKDSGDGWPDDVVFDDDFVDAAPVQEGAPPPKPSRESLREVKREAKERQRAARRPAKPPKAPRGSPTTSSNRSRTTLSIILTLAVVGGGVYFLYTDQQPTSSSVTDDPGVADPVDAEVAAEQREQDRNVDPWEGTAASDWPRGASGIEPRKARALGPYSATDVQESLTNAEAFLETAILDERVVYKGSVDPLLATLEEPDYLREQYGEPATGRSWSFLATRFRPNVVGPVGEVIRVKGDMRPVLHGETLAVRFSFAIAYAVRPLRERNDVPQLIVVRREGELEFLYDGPGAIGLPYPGEMSYVSDHSVCGRKWPFPAYTELWLDRSMKPGDEDVTGKEGHDLTDPKDSLKDFKGCFTNTGSL